MLKKFLVGFIIISVVSYIFVEREIDTMVKWEMCQNYSPISNDLDKFYYCLNLIPEYENTIIFKLNKKNYINLGCSSQKPINKNLIIHYDKSKDSASLEAPLKEINLSSNYNGEQKAVFLQEKYRVKKQKELCINFKQVK